MRLSRRNLGKALLGLSPAFLRAADVQEFDLEAAENWTKLAGTTARLFTYNAQVPGPILEAQAGDTVRIHFANRLSEPTNLHFHGLHVSPAGNADNVFLEVPPAGQMDYEFTLPPDHPAGLFWYHPHLHGSVARQLSRGLAGLFVVRGELDAIPEVAAATEHFLVLQDWAIDRLGQMIEPSMMQRMTGREGPILTASGNSNPVLNIPDGGMLRLRILNASASRFYRLKLENHPLAVIAADGGALPSPRIVDEILISPGERVDALVAGERESGEHRLLNLPYNRGGAGMPGGGPFAPPSAVATTLATLSYAERAPTRAELPASLSVIEPLPKADGPVRTFELSESGMRFLINGREFDHHRVDISVLLDSVEDWEIVNRGRMDHPFHLHTNPFQILDPQGEPEPAWKDVLLIPAGQTRRLRVRFADFAGKAVYHCHILDHEDLGMMGVIEMRNPLQP